MDAEAGSDTNDGQTLLSAFASLQAAAVAAKSNTTIYVGNGTYRNANFGTGDANDDSVVTFHGLGNIVLRNLPGQNPKIEFDGSAGLSGYAMRGFEIRGFEIEGPGSQITHEEAIADRPLHSKRFSGRGVLIAGSSHIHVHGNTIHHAPGAGIRIDGSDYCTIAGNIIYNNTWWSANAESAIVLAQSSSVDTTNTVKMRIVSNTVSEQQDAHEAGRRGRVRECSCAVTRR